MLLQLFCNDKNSNMGETRIDIDSDCATVTDIVRFIRKSQRFQQVSDVLGDGWWAHSAA